MIFNILIKYCKKVLFCFLFIVLFFTSPDSHAATITTTGSGNWSSTVPNAPWPGGTIPAAGDDIIVGTAFTLTVDGNRTCGSLSFSSTSGTISVNGGIILTVTNAITLNSNASSNYACTIAGAGTINCVSIKVGNTITPTQAQTTILTSSINQINVSGNLTISSFYSGAKKNDATFLFGSGIIAISGSILTSNQDPANTSTLSMNTGGGTGTLILSNTVPFSLSGTGTNVITLAGTGTTVNYSGAAQSVYAATYYSLILSGSGTKTITGVSTINGDFTFSGTASATAAIGITVGGHVTIGSGTTFNGGSFTHYVGGNWINNGGVFTPATSTVILNVAGSNIIGGTGTTVFSTLGVDGCTITLDPGVTYNCSDLLLGPTSAATLTFSTNSVLNVSGNVTLGSGNGAVKGNMDMTNGGYLKCSTFSNWNGNYTYGTGTVEVTGTMTGFSPTGYVDWNNLIIAGTANITFSVATAKMHGSFTLKSGSTTISGPNYINLYTAWTIESGAAFVSGSTNQSYISFEGGNTHDVYGNVSLYRVWANKTSNNPIVIHGDVTVNYGIWWDQGIFTSADGGKLIFADGYDNSMGQATNPIRCIAAPVKKIGDDAFTFPLGAGDGVNYSPLAISDPGTDVTAYYTAQYFKTGFGNYAVTQTPNSIDHVSKLEYWTLEKSAGASNVTLQLFWSTAAASGITNCSDLRIAHWNGSAWENNNDAVTTAGSCTGSGTGNIITNAVVTSYSPFTFGSKTGPNPLPVELLSFNAECIGDKINAEWETTAELNTDYFTLEKSTDGSFFLPVTNVKAAGNSSTIKNYFAEDADPYSASSYYRLSETDLNGQSKTFDIIPVAECGNNNILAFSNGNNVTITINSKEDDNYNIVLYDEQGKIIINKQEFFPAGKSSASFPVNAETGIYFLKIFNGENIRNQKLSIQQQ